MKYKGKIFSIALASAFSVFVFLFLLSAAASAAQITKIGNGYDPAVYGNTVVWTNGGVIHVYDVTSRTDTTISSSAASHPAIYENKVVWHDESSGTPKLAVYDIASGNRSYISENVDDSSIPAIYGNRIVWSANYNDSSYNYNVYMRDISTSTQTKISEGNNPDIYETKITYGYEDDYGRNIVVYDINTKETINAHHSSQVFNPYIYGNKVIWSDFYTRMGYIQMYDLVTEKTVDVTSDNTGNTLPEYANSYADAGDDTGTHIAINGDKIVYSKSGNDQFGYAGVYVYDIPTGQSTQLYNYPKEVYTTPEVYGNIVVWGFDTSFGPGTSDTGIYLCDLTTELQIPTADFSANVTSGPAPLAVLFTDTSTGLTSTSWLWDFGDDVTSTHAMNATHTFTKPGSYRVTLTMESDTSNATVIKANYITVTDPEVTDPNSPVADFSSNITKGYAPLTVQLNDLSQNAVSRSWDFENNGQEDSEEINPVYTYTSPGTYTVNLTVSNENGASSKSNTITVLKKSKSSGGSSSGGAGGSPEPAKNVEIKELSQTFITGGKTTQFDFKKNATCVVYVSFDARKNLGKTTTTAEMLKGKSALVPELPSGEVYKSFNVWVGNGGVVSSKNIENPVICFKVEKSWIQNKCIDLASITLNRYDNKKWEQMPVNISGEDEKFLYFTSNVSGYSSFAVTGKEETLKEETTTGMKPETETEEINEKDMGSAEMEEVQNQKQSQSTPGFGIDCTVICILCSLLCKNKKKSKKKN